MEEIIQMVFLFPFKGKSDEYAHVEQPILFNQQIPYEKTHFTTNIAVRIPFFCFPAASIIYAIYFFNVSTWT